MSENYIFIAIVGILLSIATGLVGYAIAGLKNRSDKETQKVTAQKIVNDGYVELRERLRVAEIEFAKEQGRLMGRQESLERQLTDARKLDVERVSSMTTMQTTIDGLVTELKDANQRLQEKDKIIESMQERLDTFEALLKTFEARLAAKQAEVNELKDNPAPL